MTRILIADSDAASRKALSLLLNRRMGITDIYEAGDAENLIRFLADNPLDILLLDWRFSGASAPETCRLILKAYPILKIVLLSVDANDSYIAIEAGAGFIHKGAGPEEVIATLRKELSLTDRATTKSNS